MKHTVSESNTNYKMRPTFNERFRPNEAKLLIEEVINEQVALHSKRMKEGIKAQAMDQDIQQQAVSPLTTLMNATTAQVKTRLVGMKKD